MYIRHVLIFLILFIKLISCSVKVLDTEMDDVLPQSYTVTKTIEFNGVSVDAVIFKPVNDYLDVLVTYHGTVQYDDKILEAAMNTLLGFQRILDRDDMMIVSIAYPEENMLFGENILHSEVGLLWVKHKAEEELGVRIGKIFLAGHSQGGYLVTRLNTMHPTNGVIANAPGPIDLIFRCMLEERGQIPSGITCDLLMNEYGSTSVNPDAYYSRSLLNFTEGFLSDILFVQGLQDSPIQMRNWPIFKDKLENCNNCNEIQYIELPDRGHSALFNSFEAKDVFNNFIERR
jgi:hypothetical protein